jgi:hypothetical protein
MNDSGDGGGSTRSTRVAFPAVLYGLLIVIVVSHCRIHRTRARSYRYTVTAITIRPPAQNIITPGLILTAVTVYQYDRVPSIRH